MRPRLPVVPRRAELDFDPLVKAADIIIKNMNGDVALNGSVPSYPQCREAADNALALDITVPDGVEAKASEANVWLTDTVRHGSERKAAVRPAGPSRRTGRCSR